MYHAIVRNPGIGWLGDDNSTLLGLGFNSLQIQQIMAAHASGALSDGGYQALVSGFVSPDNLADFMAADPGYTAAPSGSAAPTIAVSNVNQPLAPRPSPSVSAIPYASPFAWFSQATLIPGVPNLMVAIGGLIFVSVAGAMLKRR